MPLILNEAQRKLHAIAEAQKQRTGKVRIIVCKARQLGISSYISARLFHRILHSPGYRAFVIAHEKIASKNIYEMSRRFLDNLPDQLKPSVGQLNSEGFQFDKLDSGFLISVASGEGAGRSATAQLLHCSELAWWQDLPSHLASLFQIVPDEPGSEIWLESTAAGFNSFHSLWSRSVAGQTEFEAVFLPWTVDSGYVADTTGFEPDADEKKLMALHQLSPGQAAWRRNKLRQIGNEQLLNQEFPICAQDAFQSANHDCFISPALVLAARGEKVEAWGKLVLGVDVASMGDDRTAIAYRRGRVIEKVIARKHLTVTEVAGWITQIIDNEDVERVHIDTTGMGIGVFDVLSEKHRRRLINPVNFASKPLQPGELDEGGRVIAGYANRKAELWANFRKALEAGRFQIPDDDALMADLTAPGYSYNSHGALQIESKDKLRGRGVPSSDLADACILTLADGFARSTNFSRDLSEKYQGLYV